MIALIVKTILQKEMLEIVASMVDFRKSLSYHVLAEESDEVLNSPIQLTGIAKGMREAWKVWKEDGADKKKASFVAFRQHMPLNNEHFLMYESIITITSMLIKFL